MHTSKLFFRQDSDFTPQAVSTVLSKYHPGTQVRSATICAKHQGSASHIDLALDYAANPDGLPPRMFVKTLLDAERAKLPSGFAENLMGKLAVALYVTETRAYAEIATEISLETPRVFAAGLGDRPGDFFLFLENLTDRQVICPKVVPALSVDVIDRLLKQLAILHAAYWQSPRLTTDFAWLSTATTGEGSDFLREGGWASIDAEMAVPFKARILRETGIDGAELQRAFWARQESLEHGSQTLLHGDPHPGNIYFLSDGAVGLLDWQLARRGPWTHDVSYAISSALSPEDRRASERDLLNMYRSELVKLGVAQPPSADAMWLSHRQSPAWGLPMWGITPAAMYSEEEIGGVMERFSAAWRDFDTSAALGG